MKFIDAINIDDDLFETKNMLREHGILASSTDDYVNIPRYASTAKQLKRGIWVHIDEQYTDAVLLLKNSDHIVKTSLTEVQIQEIEVMAKDSFYSATTNFFNKLAAVAIVFIVCGVALYMVF